MMIGFETDRKYTVTTGVYQDPTEISIVLRYNARYEWFDVMVDQVTDYCTLRLARDLQLEHDSREAAQGFLEDNDRRGNDSWHSDIRYDKQRKARRDQIRAAADTYVKTRYPHAIPAH